MTEQEREQAFRQEFDALATKYGIMHLVPQYNIKPYTSGADFNLNFTLIRYDVILNPNWQKPAQADLPEHEPEAPKQNGAKAKEKA